ncbi:MAG TPA: ATP-binding protein, partial [Gemmataceae bacterium]|nr:ATP-binding protein [Gemmataceae bacterium]
EALERIDSSFQFALVGQEYKAREQYRKNWEAYLKNLDFERQNITLPGEGELVSKLDRLTVHYHGQGDRFYTDLPVLVAGTLGLAGSPQGPLLAASALLPGRTLYTRATSVPDRRRLYFGDKDQQGLLGTFEDIKRVSGEILRINQQNMEQASRESRRLAVGSLAWFAGGLAAAVVLAILLALHTIHTILQPIRAVTQSALGIGLGNLDQVVPVTSPDELGRLAEAFNTMGRQLRHYRQTDYSRLLRAQRTSQATIDSFPDPVLVLDTEGQVEMANPAARRQLGVVPRAREQAPVLPWQPPEPLRQPLAEALQQQRDYLPEGFNQAVPVRCDGKECFFLPRILSIRDPYENTLGAAVLLQDVTRFQLLDQVKNNLVATVSHELKTPLTSIRLVVHLLLEETTGPLTAKQTELLVDARDNAERMLATINNLLDLTHLERGHGSLEARPESPATILQAAADAVRPRAEDKGVALDVEAPLDLPMVAVDGLRFGHALNNLLDNAMTYTSRGGRITLSAAAEGEAVTLAVADTGLGIPAEYLPHVFERFFRVPGRRHEGGTGLGLAIVHDIVVAHGGTITCASEPGKGTVFRITLPAWTDQAGAEPAADGVRAASS